MMTRRELKKLKTKIEEKVMRLTETLLMVVKLQTLRTRHKLSIRTIVKLTNARQAL